MQFKSAVPQRPFLDLPWPWRAISALLSIALCSAVCACRLPVQHSALAFEAASAPVIDQAAQTYRDANTLHDLRQDYEAVEEFDAPDKVYNPRELQMLLPDKDIAVRLAVLKGLQLYTKTLCAIASGTAPKELGQASVSMAGELATLTQTLMPTMEKAAGQEKVAPVLIPADVRNGVATGVEALGEFLIARKVKAELPAKIAAMDPHVQTLAALLESDIDVLKQVEHRDYERIINLQTLALRKNETAPWKDRRDEIMKLPNIVRKERNAEERLDSLRAAVVKLAKKHQRLVAEAQDKTPRSFEEKLQELAGAADDLGSFYASL